LAYARAARPLLRWADLVYVHTLGLPLIGGSGKARRVVKIVGDQAWERAVRRGWIAETEDIDRFQSASYSAQVNLAKALRAREVRGMDAVIVPSEYLKRMVAGWGVPESRTHVVYNALPDTHNVDLSMAAARQQMALADGPLLLTAARLLPWKGVDHLIAALQRVPDVHLLVAGDGPTQPALQAQATAAGLGERVQFLGRVPQDRLAILMRAADYTVLYSGYEGLSHTLLESLRAGTPVIASDKGGNPEVVRHGVNGLLVPYVNVDALAASLAEAFSAGHRDALAANAPVGMERFDFARMVEATDQVLRAHLR
jgi:glycosyltransferase involved in cell wall biosynthesis